jgi:Zinc-finger of C2H2 type
VVASPLEQEHITNDRTGNQPCHFHHHPPCRFVRNTCLDSPGTCSVVPFEKGQPSSTAFRPPASDPSGTTPRVKRHKINYLTESARKDLSISNATHLACDSVQSTLGIRFPSICEENICFDSWSTWIRHTTSKAHKYWAECVQNTEKTQNIYCDLCNLTCKDWDALVEHFETSIHSDRRACKSVYLHL